jgi:hypothetical protein
LISLHTHTLFQTLLKVVALQEELVQKPLLAMP